MDELRRRLYQARDWNRLIRDHASVLVAACEDGSGSANAAAQLAGLAEGIVADRRVAISLYVAAYKRDPDPAWINRARFVAQELGDFPRQAALAQLEYQVTRDSGLPLVAALAHLDAGANELAVAPLVESLAQFPDDSLLRSLCRGAQGRTEELADAIRSLEVGAEASDDLVRAQYLLQAARLSRLLPGSADTLQLLMRAFDADPRQESVFSLLESRLALDQDWPRLTNLYRIRAEAAARDGRDIDVYRRAGTRLLGHSASRGLGVRLLQEGVKIIYQRELEEGASLIAMLSLIVAELLRTGAMPSAVRLLAKALAHPRSDDEVMWIVNNGIALSEGDQALTRTAGIFAALRERVLAQNPVYDAVAHDALHGGALGDIDVELEELTRPAGLAASIAARMDIAVDVQIAARAELQLDSGPVPATTRDLSSTGAFLACTAPLSVGDTLRLTMFLPGDDDWTLVEHEFLGVVARVESNIGYGIQFTEVSEAYLANLQALLTDV